MKRIGIIALSLGLATIGLALWAGSPFTNPKVVQSLGLTPEQQQKLEDMRYQYRKANVSLKKDMELNRLDLERELDKDTPDVKTIDRLVDQQGALRNQMGKARVHQLLDMKKVLTPEQWAKAKQFMQDRRAQGRGQRGGSGGFGHGGGRGQGFGGGQRGPMGPANPDDPPPSVQQLP